MLPLLILRHCYTPPLLLILRFSPYAAAYDYYAFRHADADTLLIHAAFHCRLIHCHAAACRYACFRYATRVADAASAMIFYAIIR